MNSKARFQFGTKSAGLLLDSKLQMRYSSANEADLTPTKYVKLKSARTGQVELANGCFQPLSHLAAFAFNSLLHRLHSSAAHLLHVSNAPKDWMRTRT